MAKKLFITGTGTDVGKTFVTGLIIKKLKESKRNAAYYKVAMSGNERRADGSLIPGDAIQVKAASGICQPLEEMCPYVYENALSPHLAAQLEGNPVTMSSVKAGFETACSQYDYVTMEGSGGIVCPIRYDNTKIMLEDIIKELSVPCLIVADAGLGTINHVMLTADYMRARGITTAGIIFNRFHPGNRMEEDNVSMCEALTGLNVLACVEESSTQLAMDVEMLASLYQ